MLLNFYTLDELMKLIIYTINQKEKKPKQTLEIQLCCLNKINDQALLFLATGGQQKIV